MAESTKWTALYERLSCDDDMEGESNSIVNQKKLLTSYATREGFENIRHYTDDGFSGANFDRPEWKRMIADVEAGKIGTIIAKDMSRIGRNYLEVGFYTEILFPEKKVRFIAIGNGVDSTVQGSDEFVPFLNVLNEFYVRDCSKKIKASYQLKGKAGKHLCGNVIFGYKTDPEDKNHWIIDEEAAEVVRKIYRLCVDGHGPYQICGILRDEKIVTPGYYLAQKGLGTHQARLSKMGPYDWSTSTIALILSRPEYMGHTVSFRTRTESYKTHKAVPTDSSEWLITENTQEPIIDEETWHLVQKLRQTVRKVNHAGFVNPLTGLVYCADCGKKMRNSCKKGTPYKTDPSKVSDGADCYICRTYDCDVSTHRPRSCTAHRVNTKVLRQMLLEIIQQARQDAIEDEDAFREKLVHENAKATLAKQKLLNEKIAELEEQCEEVDSLIMGLYEANHAGKISDQRFQKMIARYEQKQFEVESELERTKATAEQLEQQNVDLEKFIRLARKYSEITELTPQIINEFVDKIVVHEATWDDAKRIQQVEVYLNYIGQITLRERELTPEEKEKQEADEKRKAKNREYARQYRAKKRLEKEAASA